MDDYFAWESYGRLRGGENWRAVGKGLEDLRNILLWCDL